jgi:malonyl CoA-acyl carrier protein transacylase/thioesterase domain-containing protein/acyl carrier protein
LVSIATACQGLIDYHCDVAIAGAISISVPNKTGYYYLEGGIESPDGHCRAFDADAKGTVFSDGIGVTVLKRLDDAVRDGDFVYAVIKGWNINNDGGNKAGFTAPSVDGQAKCIAGALAFANMSAESIQFIEGHGTGTILGDAIELAALSKVFQSQTLQKQFCAIGSVKTNIGHTDIASGMASFIKTTLALQRKVIPATLNFQAPNAKMDLVKGPFYVNSQPKNWESKVLPRRAGINALGVGGTNAFLVLEEFLENSSVHLSRSYQLLVLSAKNKTSLELQTQNLIKKIETVQTPGEFANIAYTLQLGRSNFEYRKVILCSNPEDALDKMKNYRSDVVSSKIEGNSSNIVFMFPGQGSQYSGMGKMLYNSEPKFAELLNDCLRHLELSIRELVQAYIFETNQGLEDTTFIQPALFILEYALAKFWMFCGIKPTFMIGHSLGEYVAATLSGVMNFTEALNLVCIRAKLMATTAPGMMLSIGEPAKIILPLLRKTGLSIAAINSHHNCVISGESAAILEFEEKLKQQNIVVRRLKVAHGFHSDLMNPILNAFNASLEQINFQKPTIPYVSNVTGKWINDEEVRTPDYWLKHLRYTVKFAEGFLTLANGDNNVFVEVGPGKTLATFTKEISKINSKICIQNTLPTFRDQVTDQEQFLKTIGQLWLLGVTINWENFYQYEKRSRVPLPTYPFERITYWVSPDTSKESIKLDDDKTQIKIPLKSDILVDSFNEETIVHNDIESVLITIWQEILGIDKVSNTDDFYALGGHSLANLRVLSQIEKKFKVKIDFELFHQLRTINEISKKIAALCVQGSSSLMKIRNSGIHSPLFCLHPVDGTIFCYTELGKALKYDCPIYGLQDPSIENDVLLYNSLEDMAAYYIKIIQSTQKQGPYTLCGFSFGGFLAVEIARQLKMKGEKVNPLILLDAWADLPTYCFNEATFKKTISDQISYVKFDQRFLNLCWKRINLLSGYKVPTIHQKIILFKAENSSLEDGGRPDYTNCWKKYAKFGIEVHTVSGSHSTILRKPNVRKLAVLIDTVLMTIQKKGAVHG